MIKMNLQERNITQFALALPIIILILINPACGNNSTGPSQFPETSMIDYNAVWSGQYNLIAYIHDRIPGSNDSESSGIYIIRPDGTEKRLFYESEYIFGIDWSQNGMFVLANAGGRLVRISYPQGLADTLTPTGEYWSPVWSPDGNYIAFSKHAGDTRGIYTMLIDGEALRCIIKYGMFVQWPYPDSLIFLNLENRLPARTICISDTGGVSGRSIYTPTNDIVYASIVPRIHPGTRRIVFHAQKLGDAESIWVKEPGSDKALQLRRFGYSPNFSPDGEKIVFTDNHKENGRLWIVNWDGSGLFQLTFN